MHLLVFAIGILLFISLVLVHEWGHFIMARRNGVVVEEFGLGFPPMAWSRKLKSGMRLSLNYLPLGGFVKMKGEHDYDTSKGSFGAASLGAKTKIMLAGVTMNLLAGLFILTILALIGMPKLLTQDTVGQDQYTVASDTKITHQSVLAGAIIKGTPAAKIGLKGNDTILSIQNSQKTFNIKTVGQLHKATLASAGQAVKITYQKPNHKQTVTEQTTLLSLDQIVADLKKQAKLPDTAKVTKVTDQDLAGRHDATIKSVKSVKNNQDFNNAALDFFGDNLLVNYTINGRPLSKEAVLQPKAYLGISPTQLQIQKSTWSAPEVAVGLSKQIFMLTFKGLGHAISGLGSTIAGLATQNHQARENGQDQASGQVGGPVAIGVALWDYGSLGINFMLFLIALISLTLALMNVLPIPALDGGRLAMMLISRGIFKKPLSKANEERIVGASFYALLCLIVLITFVDVKRFF